MRSSGIGGQAVLEGIMMKNGTKYAVGVRKPDGDIALKVDEYPGLSAKHPWMKKPFIRGAFAMIDSLMLGMSTLTYSAEFYEDETETEHKEGFLEKHLGAEKAEAIFMGATVAVSVVIAIGIFALLPMFAARFLERWISSKLLVSVLEGLFRVGIFIAYVVLIARMEDIKRTYMYHGAEHKCISCVENGLDLTVENVRTCSKEHKRCGTSFLLFVMVISIFVFMFLQLDNVLLRMVSRILFVPVIAGISYEVLRLAGNSDNVLINLISKPGLMLQRLTTSEPTDDMIEVAIQAVEAVFDWREYEAKEFGRSFGERGAQTEEAGGNSRDRETVKETLSRRTQDRETVKEEFGLRTEDRETVPEDVLSLD